MGGYWLAGRLGTGGQGVVYEGYAEDGTRVAIKVLRGDQAPQLAKEAATAQRVSSFCTTRVIEARLEGPRPYLVSEYVAGPSLRRAVADGRRYLDQWVDPSMSGPMALRKASTRASAYRGVSGPERSSQRW